MKNEDSLILWPFIQMKVITGAYEQVIYGFTYDSDAGNVLTPLFTLQNHKGSIKDVASSADGQWVVAG